MFKSIGNFLTKVLIPLIVKRISLDVDTVHRAAGTYIRIRVEALGFTLLDTEIKLSSDTETMDGILQIDEMPDVKIPSLLDDIKKIKGREVQK